MRKRFKDKFNVGKSSTVPYIESEGWKERHERRKSVAAQRMGEVNVWCQKHKWKFRVANNGHHWIFTTHESKMIEWFPSSGKLVIGKNWRNGFHVHDVQQLIELLEETL